MHFTARPTSHLEPFPPSTRVVQRIGIVGQLCCHHLGKTWFETVWLQGIQQALHRHYLKAAPEHSQLLGAQWSGIVGQESPFAQNELDTCIYAYMHVWIYVDMYRYCIDMYRYRYV